MAGAPKCGHVLATALHQFGACTARITGHTSARISAHNTMYALHMVCAWDVMRKCAAQGRTWSTRGTMAPARRSMCMHCALHCTHAALVHTAGEDMEHPGDQGPGMEARLESLPCTLCTSAAGDMYMVGLG